MGTDIHGYWEIKMKTEEWMAIRRIKDDRNYIWFGIVGGVRNDFIWPEGGPWDRGIPKDRSLAWKDFTSSWGSDHMHNKTWLSFKEAHQAVEYYWDEITKWKDIEVEDWEGDFQTPIHLPHDDDLVESLIFGYSENNMSTERDIRLPWMVQAKDCMFSDDLYECCRLVIGFDS